MHHSQIIGDSIIRVPNSYPKSIDLPPSNMMKRPTYVTIEAKPNPYQPNRGPVTASHALYPPMQKRQVDMEPPERKERPMAEAGIGKQGASEQLQRGSSTPHMKMLNQRQFEVVTRVKSIGSMYNPRTTARNNIDKLVQTNNLPKANQSPGKPPSRSSPRINTSLN